MASPTKVVLVGDNGVGKSSLITRFTQNGFMDRIHGSFWTGDYETKEWTVGKQVMKV